MNRQSAWESSTLGTVATSNNYVELLQKADLDYTAIETPAYAEYNGQSLLIPNKKAILREDTGEVLGLVSNKYQLCQNRDALSFVNYIDGIELIKAGSFGMSGGGIYMIGQLPSVEVLGDTITPHLIFQNSHDGTASIKATICMLRIVCKNQFVSSFRDSPATVTISHRGELESKLIQANNTLSSVYEYVKHYDAFANDQVTQHVDSAMFNRIVEKYFAIPEDASDRTITNIVDCRNMFTLAYDADDNQNFKGTKWGVINAFSDYLTHKDPLKKGKNWEANKLFNTINPTYIDQFRRIVDAA